MNIQELQQFFSQLPPELQEKVSRIPNEQEKMQVLTALYQKYLMKTGAMQPASQNMPQQMQQEEALEPMAKYGYMAKYGMYAQEGMNTQEQVPVEAERNETITTEGNIPSTEGGYLKPKSTNPVTGQRTFEIPDNQHNNTHEQSGNGSKETGVNMNLTPGDVVNSDKTKIPFDFMITSSNYKNKTFKEASDKISALEKKQEKKLKELQKKGMLDEVAEQTLALNFAKFGKLRQELNDAQETVLELNKQEEVNENTNSLMGEFGINVKKLNKANKIYTETLDGFLNGKTGYKKPETVIKAEKGLNARIAAMDTLLETAREKDLDIEGISATAKQLGLLDSYGSGISSSSPKSPSKIKPFAYSPSSDTLQQFKDVLAGEESSASENPYAAYNPNTSEGTWGKYQFVWSLWKDKIKKQTGITDPKEWTKNPAAQEQFMDWYIKNNLMPTAAKLKQKYQMPFNIYEIMAGIHLEGEGKPFKKGEEPEGFLGKYMAGQLNKSTMAGKFKNKATGDYISAFSQFPDEQPEMKFGGHIPKYTPQNYFTIEDDNDKYFPKQSKIFAQGGANTSNDDWIKQILNFETNSGSAQGSGLPNYGIKRDVWGTKYAPMWADDKIEEAEAIDFIRQEYLPKVQQYPPEIQARLVDYAYNTGRDIEDLLLYTIGDRNLQAVQTTPTDSDLFKKRQADILKAANSPGFAGILDKAKREILSDTWSRKNSPDVYTKTSLPRINMWEKYNFSSNPTIFPASSPSTPAVVSSSSKPDYTFGELAPFKKTPIDPSDFSTRFPNYSSWTSTLSALEQQNPKVIDEMTTAFNKEKGTNYTSEQFKKYITDKTVGTVTNWAAKYVSDKVQPSSDLSVPVPGSKYTDILQPSLINIPLSKPSIVTNIPSEEITDKSGKASSSSQPSSEPGVGFQNPEATWWQKMNYGVNKMLPAANALSLMMEKPIYPTLQRKRAMYTPLRTDVDIQPQLNEAQRMYSTVQSDTRGNPSVRAARLAQMYANTQGNMNEVLANKYNMETQMGNQERMRKDQYFNQLDDINRQYQKQYETEYLQTLENVRQQRRQASDDLINMKLRDAEQTRATELALANTIYDYDPITGNVITNESKLKQHTAYRLLMNDYENLLNRMQKAQEELAKTTNPDDKKSLEEQIADMKKEQAEFRASLSPAKKKLGGRITSKKQQVKDSKIQESLNPEFNFRKYFPMY